jgi:hypothetical protein
MIPMHNTVKIIGNSIWVIANNPKLNTATVGKAIVRKFITAEA